VSEDQRFHVAVQLLAIPFVIFAIHFVIRWKSTALAV
jgi:hypothetical protein